MKLDAEIFDADLNENRCKFARQPPAARHHPLGPALHLLPAEDVDRRGAVLTFSQDSRLGQLLPHHQVRVAPHRYAALAREAVE